MAGIAEDQGPRLQLRETSTSPAAPLRRLHEKKNPEPPSRPHLSTRLLSATARRRRHATGEAEASRARDSVPRPCRPSSVGRRPPVRRPSPRSQADPAPLCGCAAQLPANRHRSCSSPARSPTSRLPTPSAPCFPVRFPPPPWLVAGPLSQFPKVCQAISPKISNPNQWDWGWISWLVKLIQYVLVIYRICDLWTMNMSYSFAFFIFIYYGGWSWLLLNEDYLS